MKTLAPGMAEWRFSATAPVMAYFCCAKMKKGAKKKAIRKRIKNPLAKDNQCASFLII